MPILSDREAYLDGFGVDRLEEEGTVVLICKTLQDKPDLLKKLGI